jgi:arginine transport system substrate-binding protein
MSIKSVLLSLIFGILLCSSSFANIRVGTLYFYPPFILSENEGFDIELLELVCQKLKQECDLVPMSLNQLYTGLNEDKIDIAIGGIAIPTAPDPVYIYSLPYLLSKGQFMTLKGGTVNSISDLNGTAVGVIYDTEDGGSFYNYLQSTYTGKFHLKFYNNVADLVNALNNKVISAAFLHRSSVNYWVQNSDNDFKRLGADVTIGDGIGIMALPKNQALIDQINLVLQQLAKENLYLQLYNTYFPDE